MNKRQIVKQAIEAGGATKESLMEVAEVNDKGLASLLTYLRWGGICPIKGEDGIYTLITEEEWETHKANRIGVGVASSLTPEERLEKATKRTTRAASALDKAKVRFDANPDDKLIDLQHEKAGLELQISELLEGRAEAEVKEHPTPPTPDSVDLVTDPVEEDSPSALDALEKEFDGEEIEDEFL